MIPTEFRIVVTRGEEAGEELRKIPNIYSDAKYIQVSTAIPVMP